MLRKRVASGRRKVACDVDESDRDNEELSSSPTNSAQFVLEDWVSWVARQTHTAQHEMAKWGIEDLVILQRRRKWKWAGQVTRRDDERWSTTLLHWRPKGRRNVGHPIKRWEDDLLQFFVRYEGDPSEWSINAFDRETWSNLESEFILQ
jgi:hypothetical protein